MISQPGCSCCIFCHCSSCTCSLRYEDIPAFVISKLIIVLCSRAESSCDFMRSTCYFMITWNQWGAMLHRMSCCVETRVLACPPWCVLSFLKYESAVVLLAMSDTLKAVSFVGHQVMWLFMWVEQCSFCIMCENSRPSVCTLGFLMWSTVLN